MRHPGFFKNAGPFSVAQIARETSGAFDGDGALEISNIKTLAMSGRGDISFFNNRKYLGDLETSQASACLVEAAFRDRVPGGTTAIVVKDPYRAFAAVLRLFYPDSLRTHAATGQLSAGVDSTARLEEGTVVEPGATVGPEAEIGAGTRVCAGAVVGFRCHVGRDSYIGAGATLTHALLGDRVIIHAGARIGQDGFGFAMGGDGHQKVPQIGRVIIQNDVEIGANSTVDRGALPDTVIGEGTKIDNLVQIGHNVVIGRHCVIVAQTGISGSSELGDFVVMGGQSGAVGHIKIGDGAQIAGGSHPKSDVPPGARMGGTPARPLRQWAREIVLLQRLAKDAHDKGRD